MKLKELDNTPDKDIFTADLIIDSKGKVIKDRYGVCNDIKKILVVK